MNSDCTKQLNAFELKQEISRLANVIEESTVLIEQTEFSLLDNQKDKDLIVKIALKEFSRGQEKMMPALKIILIRYGKKNSLISPLEEIIKKADNSNDLKLHAIEVIELIDPMKRNDGWYDKYLNYDEDLIREETENIARLAQQSPEIQIDFLDFYKMLGEEDKELFIQSFANEKNPADYANLLTPLFLSNTYLTNIAREILKLLGSSKSIYTYKALNEVYEYLPNDIKPAVKRCLNELKLSGVAMQIANEKKEQPKGDFYIIPPDGEGRTTLIYQAPSPQELDKILILGIVLDDYFGIKECLGFMAISEFEASVLFGKLLGTNPKTKIPPDVFKMLIKNAEKLTYTTKTAPIAEYNCWKNLFIDIEPADFDIKELIKSKSENIKLTNDDLETVFNDDISMPWFYEENFGDETENFFAELNSMLKYKSLDEIDIEGYVKTGIKSVLYKDEREKWTERLILSAYCKYLDNDKKMMNILYSLSQDEAALNELYLFILRQSVFQYFLSMLTEENYLIYDKETLEANLSYLSGIWGFYV